MFFVALALCGTAVGLGAGATADPATLSGVIGAGKSGSLVGPFSGRVCVWYRSESWFGGPARGQLASRALSTIPFLLEDGSGALAIDPARAHVEGRLVVEERQADGASNVLVRREWLLCPGDAVELRGAVTAAEWVAPASGPHRMRLVGGERRSSGLEHACLLSLALAVVGPVLVLLTWPR